MAKILKLLGAIVAVVILYYMGEATYYQLSARLEYNDLMMWWEIWLSPIFLMLFVVPFIILARIKASPLLWMKTSFGIIFLFCCWMFTTLFTINNKTSSILQPDGTILAKSDRGGFVPGESVNLHGIIFSELYRGHTLPLREKSITLKPKDEISKLMQEGGIGVLRELSNPLQMEFKNDPIWGDTIVFKTTVEKSEFRNLIISLNAWLVTKQGNGGPRYFGKIIFTPDGQVDKSQEVSGTAEFHLFSLPGHDIMARPGHHGPKIITQEPPACPGAHYVIEKKLLTISDL